MLLSIQVHYRLSKGQALTLMNRNCIRQPERKLGTGTRNALELKGTHVRKDWNYPRGTIRKGWSLIATHLDQQQRKHYRRQILTYVCLERLELPQGDSQERVVPYSHPP